jgi:hypothetical protein
MTISVERRILGGWIVALSTLWAVLKFGLRVSHPLAWVAILAVAVFINGLVATYLDRDE